MPYIGKSPSAVGVRNRFYFTASGGETSLSGSDDNGKTLVFSDASYVDVILNGGNLVSGTDYTATPSTNTISGLTALVANDVVEIIAYDVFSVSDTVSAASGGTFQSNVNFDSGINVTSTVTADGLTVDTDTLYVDSTNNRVGISTSSPNVKAEVGGTDAAVSLRVNTQNAGVSASNYSQIQLSDNGTVRSYWRNVRDGSGATQFAYNDYLAFLSDADGTPTERMRLTTTGLGIGTNSPYSYGKLTVKGGNGTQLVLDNAGEQYTQMYFLNNGTDKGSIWVDNSLSLFSFTARSGMGMNFYTNNSEAMRIDSSGNLIIGATYSSAPGSITLQSDGDIAGVLASGAGGDTLISAISGVSNGYQISVDTSNNQTYKWHNGGTQSMTLDSIGNLGIGSLTPSFRLAVEDGSGATRVNVRNNANAAAGSGIFFQVLNGGSVVGNGTIATQSNGDMAFFTGTSSGTERMRITSAGNVGIGITSPEARLDVLGNSDVTAALKIGPNANFGHHFYDSSTNGDLVIKREVSGVQTETMRLTRSGGYVGIGHNVPTAKGLQIRGQGRVFNNTIWDPYNDNTASVNDRSILYVESNSNAAADYGSSIGFRGRAGITVDYVTFATIAGVKENSTTDGSGSYSTQVQGCLDFYTAEGYDFSPNYAVRQQRRMRIDSGGRVTAPYQPSWNTRSYAHNGASTGTTRVGSTDNSGSLAFTTQVGTGLNNGRFTAPVAGTYWVHVNGSDSYSGNAGLQILKNGGTSVSSTAYLYGMNYNGTGVSAAVYLSAGDYVEGHFVHFNNVTSQLYDGSFSGFLIG